MMDLDTPYGCRSHVRLDTQIPFAWRYVILHSISTYFIYLQRSSYNFHESEPQRKMSFRDKIKSALVHALHNDPDEVANGVSAFIEQFQQFEDDLERTEAWEKELAIREVYKGDMPFVWGSCEALEGYAFPVESDEYNENIDWCEDIENLCLFIKNIDKYIE